MWKFRWLSASASERIINNQSWGKSEMRFKGIHHVEFPVLDYDNSIPCADQWKTDDFYCREIAPDHYPLTYTLHQDPRVTQRATLWRKLPDRRVAVYHQGTVVDGIAG